VKIVLNTSPLIFLSKLGYLNALKQIFSEVHIPNAVLKELTAKRDETYDDVSKLINESFIIVDEVETIEVLKANLHAGEAEAIILAKKLSCWVVLDDSKARKTAEKEGLNVIGTAGLLKVMSKMGLIRENPEELFEKLSAIKFRMKKEQFLEIFRD